MKKGSWGWPLGITLLLATFVGSNLFLMHVAGSDPSFAIEPDYYKKAIAFDSTMAEERRSNTLGWHAEARIDAMHATHTVIVALTDAQQKPLTGAVVVVHARFNARANDVVADTLTETPAGVYSAPLVASHAGEWEVQIDARRGSAHFMTSVRTDVRIAAVATESLRASAP